jgi:hypothetical protein
MSMQKGTIEVNGAELDRERSAEMARTPPCRSELQGTRAARMNHIGGRLQSRVDPQIGQDAVDVFSGRTRSDREALGYLRPFSPSTSAASTSRSRGVR